MVTNMRSVAMRAVVLLAICWGVCTSAASAGQSTAGQIWLINTRRAPCFVEGAADAAQLEYWRLGDGQWEFANLEAFLAANDPTITTVFYLHGNRQDEVSAVYEGYQFYQTLQCQTPNHPMRYVIWSWPSDQVSNRVRVDAQVKAERTDGQSCYLAQVLGRLDPRVRVTLVGYSFGARISTGAMHLLAGGDLGGQHVALPNPAAERVMARAVLVAAAQDCDWLSPGSCHGLALNRLERTLITINQGDPAMKHYSALYGRGGPEALGYTGPACGADGAKIELINVSCSTGKTHSWDCYSSDPNLLARLPWYAFLAPAPLAGYTAKNPP